MADARRRRPDRRRRRWPARRAPRRCARRGFDGSVLLVGPRAATRPTSARPRSKDYLRGETERDDALPAPGRLVGGARRRAAHAHERDEARHRRRRSPSCRTKDERRLRPALLATGANVRRLRVDGGDLEGIHYLRALGNADAIRADAEDAERVVLVGGSYIACEVAASLTALGKQLHDGDARGRAAVDRLRRARRARFFAGVLRAHGDRARHRRRRWRASRASERVERVVDRVGRDARRRPRRDRHRRGARRMLARSAGLELGESGGVACSRRCETSAPGVWAAGDAVRVRLGRCTAGGCGSSTGRSPPPRARYAARRCSATPGRYDEVPYFWSDLADWATLEYVGPAAQWDREVVRGSLDDGEFTIFYLDGGRSPARSPSGAPTTWSRPEELPTAQPVDADALGRRSTSRSTVAGDPDALRRERDGLALDVRASRRRRCRAGSSRRRGGARSSPRAISWPSAVVTDGRRAPTMPASVRCGSRSDDEHAAGHDAAPALGEAATAAPAGGRRRA